jgi:hypothetical protein
MRALRAVARAEIAATLQELSGGAAAGDADATMAAVVDAHGEVTPLVSDDEAALPDIPADALSAGDQRRAVQQLAYHAQHMRASVEEPVDLDTYSAALEAEFGSDLEGLGNPMRGGRASDYALGSDPLLDAREGGLPFSTDALAFKTYMTWNAPPGSRAIDRCVRVGGAVGGGGGLSAWRTAADQRGADRPVLASLPRSRVLVASEAPRPSVVGCLPCPACVHHSPPLTLPHYALSYLSSYCRRAVLSCVVAQLGLADTVAQYVRSIAAGEGWA